jgi:hypothetical protein
MERYARIIQESQYDLGLEVSSFDNIGTPALAFLSKLFQMKSIKVTHTNKKDSLMLMERVTQLSAELN